MVLSMLAFNSRRDSRGVFCSLRTLQPLAQVSIGEACWSIYRIASASSLPPGDGVLLEDFLLLDWLSNGIVVALIICRFMSTWASSWRAGWTFTNLVWVQVPA
jgi:hypothetical protein